jgi:hypothetical protein
MTVTSLQPETELLKKLVAENAFLQELTRQVRAQDHYGTFRNWEDRLVLTPFVVTKKKKKEISFEGDVDPVTQLSVLS